MKSVIHPQADCRVLKLVRSYLTSVLCHRVVHLPAVHRKLLLVQEGKQGLPEDVTEQFSHDEKSKGFFFFFFFVWLRHFHALNKLLLTSYLSSHFGHSDKMYRELAETT